MKKLYLSILAIATICFFNSCYYDNFKELHPESALDSNNCDTSGVISYSLHIKPILDASCNKNCHNPTATSGTRDLTNFAMVAAATNDGTANPGDWGSLYGTTSWDLAYGNNMPKNGSKLPDCDLIKIKKWAIAGAPNN
jgi:hypothetical protein